MRVGQRGGGGPECQRHLPERPNPPRDRQVGRRKRWRPRAGAQSRETCPTSAHTWPTMFAIGGLWPTDMWELLQNCSGDSFPGIRAHREAIVQSNLREMLEYCVGECDAPRSTDRVIDFSHFQCRWLRSKSQSRLDNSFHVTLPACVKHGPNLVELRLWSNSAQFGQASALCWVELGQNRSYVWPSSAEPDPYLTESGPNLVAWTRIFPRSVCKCGRFQIGNI